MMEVVVGLVSRCGSVLEGCQSNLREEVSCQSRFGGGR